MTEEAFQAARKVMASANHLRGLITNAKANVAKWTSIEDSHRRNLKERQAEGARKCIEKALAKLEQHRAKFAALTFPEPNLTISKPITAQCEACGQQVAKGKAYCNSCLSED